MELQIKSIRHNPHRKRPLTVVFTLRRDEPEEVPTEYAIDVESSHLQSFASFQRVVLSKLGLLVRLYSIENEPRAHVAKQRWLDQVDWALNRGQSDPSEFLGPTK